MGIIRDEGCDADAKRVTVEELQSTCDLSSQMLNDVIMFGASSHHKDSQSPPGERRELMDIDKILRAVASSDGRASQVGRAEETLGLLCCFLLFFVVRKVEN